MMERDGIKATVIEAPTGFGKTQYALELVKKGNKELILSVPTIKLAREVQKRAEENGIKSVLLLGRRNYPCGYKVQKFYELPEDREVVREKCLECYENGEKLLFQGIFCCKRKKCQWDMFDEKKTEALNSPLVITTHALLKTSAFANIFPVGRTLFIDEVHLFIRNLTRPIFPYTSFSSSEFKAILTELKEIITKKSEVNKLFSQVESIEKFIRRAIGSREKRSILLWVRKRDSMEYVDRNLSLVVDGAVKLLVRGINKFLGKLNKEERELVGDFFSAVNSLLLKIFTKESSQAGEYLVLSSGEGFRLDLKQTLFSPAMWKIWNMIFANLSPVEVFFASATVPKSLNKLLSSSRFKDVEFVKHFHRFDSVLDVVIGGRAYSYEEREDFLKYFVRFFRKFKREKGAVILASSYTDMEFIEKKLKKKGYSVLSQKENEDAEKIVSLYEKGEVDVIIGNRTFWEGINIRRDSDFFIVKVPYSTPDDPDYRAGEIFYERNFFPIHKSDVRDLMIQGIGRVIRNNGEHKRIFIADNRILSFDCLFAEVPANKRYLVIKDLSVLKNKNVNKI